MRILLTGVGCPGIVGTLKALRDNPSKEKVYIFGTDIKKDVIGRLLCDDFQRIDPPKTAKYIHVLQRICEVNKIDIIIPQTTKETIILSDYKKSFNTLGIKVLVPDKKAVKLYNDKHRLLNIFEKNNLPHTKYYTVNDKETLKMCVYKLGYPDFPVVVKPLNSNGGRGVRILQRNQSYEEYLNEKPDGMKTTLRNLLYVFNSADKWPDVLVTEYLPGKEYSVDVLNLPGCRRIIPRIRNKIRSGISFITEVIENKSITNQINTILNNNPMYGVFGFQFKENDNKIPCILECNPRIQGTMIAAHFAGINIIWAAVKYLIGEKLKTDLKEIPDKIKFYRYWGGTTDAGGKIEII